MDNKIKVEEKLTREEIDFLKINLETCFNVIVKSNGVGEFDIKKDDDDKDKFLETFSPWHQRAGIDLIDKFVNTIYDPDSIKDFSWLDILGKDKRWRKLSDEETKNEIEDKSKHVNMRYQIPTHFHGDIDNAVLFYCMENPRGYIKDSDMDTWAKNQMLGKQTIDDYYKHTADLRDEPWKNKTIKKIIEERYQLNDVNIDLNKSIKKIIYSDDKNESPLARELDNMFDEKPKFFQEEYILKKDKRSKKPDLSEKYYYIARFYAQLLGINSGNLSKYNIESEEKEEAQAERNKAIKISEKICNVEIYPFSSSEPKLQGIGETILLNSDLSRLGAYIILRRIYRYLNSPKKNPKPIIVLRKYNSAWEKLFNKILEEVKQIEQSFDDRLVLSLLEKGFFYCQTGPRGGGITSGNVISVPNFRTVDRKDSKLFDDTKMKDFNSIKSVLTKAES